LAAKANETGMDRAGIGDHSGYPIGRVEYELTVTGTFRYAHTWPAAIALATSGAVELDRLVSGRYGLDQVREALTVGRVDPKSMKPVVRPAAS
jgi:L-iditol 2-dehydrogenase